MPTEMRRTRAPQPDDGIGATEVGRILGIHRNTVYRTRALMRLAFYPLPNDPSSPRWTRRDVEIYKVQRSAAGRAA